jgi:hypothetical protein
MSKDKKVKPKALVLPSPYDIPLVRYIKIKGNTNPFNPENRYYFAMRRKAKNYRPFDSNNTTVGLPLKEGLAGARAV